MKPGIHQLGSDHYHADPCDRPSLSASLAHVLLSSSPKHAWTAHPRLNPDFQRTEEAKFDVGNVCHSLLLQGIETAEVLPFPDWRTNAAKEARDLARSHGRIPMLTKHAHEVEQMVGAVKLQLPLFNVTPPLLQNGKPEQTLVWEEAGVLCRARLDWLRDDHAAVDDLKTTSRSANPEQWSRTLFGIGADIQAAFYLRGIKALTGKTPEWRWIVCETAPPYAMSVISPGPAAVELGNAKVDRALELWRTCLATDEWPSYPTQVCYADVPGWEESRWLEREAREEIAA